MNNDTPSISDWIKANSSVSTVAADLNLSRPTVYKYMEKFDNGDMDKIPPEVVEYFKQKLSSGMDQKEKLEKRMELEKENSVFMDELRDLHIKMDKLMKERDLFYHDISANQECGLNEVAERMAKMAAIEKEFVRISDRINQTEMRIDDNKRKAAELANAKYVINPKATFNLKSECYAENGRYMVIHTGEFIKEALWHDDHNILEEPLYYRLHLYAKIGDDYAHLGTYKPVRGRNFFVIDDVFMSIPLYYNIVTCVVMEGFEDWKSLAEGEDPPLQELAGKECTGLCELRPKK